MKEIIVKVTRNFPTIWCLFEKGRRQDFSTGGGGGGAEQTPASYWYLGAYKVVLSL